MKNKVLIVAVHPDDETLGCGGTLLKHKANGDKTNWLICTTIDKNHLHYKVREQEIKKVITLQTTNLLQMLMRPILPKGLRKRNLKLQLKI